MARQLTTKAQVNGYRFLLKRLEHALVRRDVRMLHDPMRSQFRALAVGTVLALLVVAGCGIWSLVKPRGSVGDSTILVSKDSGGMYVLIDDTLHPVLNVSSARLITGSSASPTSVSDAKMSGYPRGPLLGIPGAPVSVPPSAHPGISVWSACDQVGGQSSAAAVELTVIGDAPVLSEQIDAAGADDALLVTDGAATFLIYQLMRGDHLTPVRAEVDPGSVPVMRALGLEGVSPRAISTGVLNTFPEVDPLRLPTINDLGGTTPLSRNGIRVGTVLRSVGVDDEESYYVALDAGVQQVSAPTAEMLRLADREGAAEVTTVSPGAITAVPRVSTLPVSDFPAATPHVLAASAAPTVCSVWSSQAGHAQPRTTMLMGRQLPISSAARPVQLTSADGSGPGVDQVYLRPGSGEYLQVTGNGSDSARAESLFYLSDSGVRFGIPDLATGAILGLGEHPAPAPWSVISLLTAGPTLSRHDALVAHDGIAADPAGQPVPASG